MNAELVKKALEKVGNPNVLVNIISRRVRQLTAGGGGSSRPLIVCPPGVGAGDTALHELIEDKMGWELLEQPQAVEPPPKKRKKS